MRVCGVTIWNSQLVLSGSFHCLIVVTKKWVILLFCKVCENRRHQREGGPKHRYYPLRKPLLRQIVLSGTWQDIREGNRWCLAEVTSWFLNLWWREHMAFTSSPLSRTHRWFISKVENAPLNLSLPLLSHVFGAHILGDFQSAPSGFIAGPPGMRLLFSKLLLV